MPKIKKTRVTERKVGNVTVRKTVTISVSKPSKKRK
jgi:hypothetical protein